MWFRCMLVNQSASITVIDLTSKSRTIELWEFHKAFTTSLSEAIAIGGKSCSFDCLNTYLTVSYEVSEEFDRTLPKQLQDHERVKV